MAAPKWGCFEVVNKNKEGEIIAVLAGANAAELSIEGRDPAGYLPGHLRLGVLPEQSVVNGRIDESVTMLQVVLYYGSKYKAIERARAGSVSDNFEFCKLYEVRCRGRNVLLKYKGGQLELQKGQSGALFGKKRSLGGGIDMTTNATEIQEVQLP